MRGLPYGSGRTVLEQVIRKLKKSKKLNNIIIATTTGKDENENVATMSFIERKEDGARKKQETISH